MYKMPKDNLAEGNAECSRMSIAEKIKEKQKQVRCLMGTREYDLARLELKGYLEALADVRELIERTEHICLTQISNVLTQFCDVCKFRKEVLAKLPKEKA